MKINALVVRKNVLSSNEIIWCEGIEDSNTEVSVILPKSLFTKEEVVNIKSDGTIFSSTMFDGDSDFVCINNLNAYQLDGLELINIKFEIIEKEINVSDFLKNYDSNDLNKTLISAVVVFDKKNDELLFAEGTEVDGYQYHQVFIPLNKVDESDVNYILNHNSMASVTSDKLYLGECEAKDHSFETDNIFIGKVTFKI